MTDGPQPARRRVRRPTRPLATLIAVGVMAFALGSCGQGEVTTLLLPVSPDNTTEFIAAQQSMLTIGCGIVGCHGTIVGNFQVTDDPATRQDEYLLAKPLVDQAAPDDSALLRVALAGDPAAVGHPICFKDTEGCAWQIITAWIADGDPTASAVAMDCVPTENACRTGGD